MTERLCYWPKDDSAISERGVPTEAYTHLYRGWGEGQTGMIVVGSMMDAYDAVEAFGNPLLCDNHDGRVAKYRQVVDVSR